MTTPEKTPETEIVTLDRFLRMVAQVAADDFEHRATLNRGESINDEPMVSPEQRRAGEDAAVAAARAWLIPRPLAREALVAELAPELRGSIDAELSQAGAVQAERLRAEHLGALQARLRYGALTWEEALEAVDRLRSTRDRRVAELEAERARRFDCHAGPGTTEPACGACTTCLNRALDDAGQQIRDLSEQLNSAYEAARTVHAELKMQADTAADQAAQPGDQEYYRGMASAYKEAAQLLGGTEVRS